MKIGILTFHRAHNYGAMLQAFALRKVLIRKGYDVEFISYRQFHIEHAYKTWIWKVDKTKGFIYNFKIFISNVLTFYRRKKRSKAFNIFASHYLPESYKYTREDLLKSELNYDVVVFGSDQIWTTRFMGTFDEVFWGNIHLKKGRKIAYAPSMELKSVSEKEKEFIRKNIRNFDSVSARETQMAELLEGITNISVQTVVDPTLLCRKDDYEELILSSKHIPQGPYVLVYQVGHYKQVKDIALEVANQLNCPILEIGSDVLLHNDATYRDGYGPADFVALIYHATFVVSGSFHGTAFSVNFHKPFYSVLISGIDSRAISFLSQIGLMDCGIRTASDVNVQSVMNIDYVKVDSKLEEMRNASMAYIDQSLK